MNRDGFGRWRKPPFVDVPWAIVRESEEKLKKLEPDVVACLARLAVAEPAIASLLSEVATLLNEMERITPLVEALFLTNQKTDLLFEGVKRLLVDQHLTSATENSFERTRTFLTGTDKVRQFFTAGSVARAVRAAAPHTFDTSAAFVQDTASICFPTKGRFAVKLAANVLRSFCAADEALNLLAPEGEAGGFAARGGRLGIAFGRAVCDATTFNPPAANSEVSRFTPPPATMDYLDVRADHTPFTLTHRAYTDGSGAVMTRCTQDMSLCLPARPSRLWLGTEVGVSDGTCVSCDHLETTFLLEIGDSAAPGVLPGEVGHVLSWAATPYVWYGANFTNDSGNRCRLRDDTSGFQSYELMDLAVEVQRIDPYRPDYTTRVEGYTFAPLVRTA